jgi:hypothetical protein
MIPHTSTLDIKRVSKSCPGVHASDNCGPGHLDPPVGVSRTVSVGRLETFGGAFENRRAPFFLWGKVSKAPQGGRKTCRVFTEEPLAGLARDFTGENVGFQRSPLRDAHGDRRPWAWAQKAM